MVDFSYYGGILDESGIMPRFARSTISKPYYLEEGSPIGYTAHYFYNDIDNSGFPDANIYNEMQFPDLESETQFGVANGGYKLDGLEYLSYSYITGNSPSTCNDSLRNYYTLYEPPQDIQQINRIKLDSTHIREDCVAQDILYTYDEYNGQVNHRSFRITTLRSLTRATTIFCSNEVYLIVSVCWNNW